MMSKAEDDLMYLCKNSPTPIADILWIYIKSHNDTAAKFSTDDLSELYLDVHVWNVLYKELEKVNGLLITDRGFIWLHTCQIIPIVIPQVRRMREPELSHMFFIQTFSGKRVSV